MPSSPSVGLGVHAPFEYATTSQHFEESRNECSNDWFRGGARHPGIFEAAIVGMIVFVDSANFSASSSSHLFAPFHSVPTR